MKIYEYNGLTNVIGKNIRKIRTLQNPKVTQEDLSARLGVLGYNIDRAKISRIESGNRIVTDYEVSLFAKALKVSILNLYKDVEI